MIILAYDWWDEWMDRVSRCHYVLASWTHHPIVRMVSYEPYIIVDSEAWFVYDIDGMNVCWNNKYLIKEMNEMREKYTFTI
jgi:hypothetical protein